MTGIGGDMFCLFYNAKTRQVQALNGSGRSGAKLDISTLRKDMNLQPGQRGSLHHLSAHAVTVPGAAAGWIDTVKDFGSGAVSMEDVFKPAIELAEEGYPVSEISAQIVSMLYSVPLSFGSSKFCN